MSDESAMSDELASIELGDVLGRLRWPFRPEVSGSYSWSSLAVGSPGPVHAPGAGRLETAPLGPDGSADDGSATGASAEIVLPASGPGDDTQGVWPLRLSSETIRLDVDGRYPQMTVSGEIRSGLTGRVHWIAGLAPTAGSTWEGTIWYRHGTTTLMPFTDIRVVAVRSWFGHQRSVTIEFRQGTVLRRTRRYAWRSPHFREVEFEFDHTADANPVTEIGTSDHPNRPARLAAERLSIDDVFERAGFAVSQSTGGDVPLSGAGADGTWSDTEMHDAMIAYWSRFDDRPQWSMWTFWCALHDRGSSLGGIMFDDIGSNHRQGTAIFTEAFIKNPPGNDPDPGAWVARMRFWTAVHEMGHAFNLAHAWQKSLGASWIPMADEPEGRSFMNYPFRVAGGEAAFFADFEHRFSDQELLFMRHAPEAFVQMGNADWFDDHGFEQAAPEQSGLQLELRMHRIRRVFEFMEPVTLELKLLNAGSRPVLIDTDALSDGDELTVIIKRDGRPARSWHPYATYARNEQVEALSPGQARYAPLSISNGLNGCDLAEPGNYAVQVALDIDGTMVVSNPLTLRVAVPRSLDEEDLAGDFFTEDVSRAIALGGTRVMKAAIGVLENVVDRTPTSRAALHARAALATPRLHDFKVLRFDRGGGADAVHPTVAVEEAAVAEASATLVTALVDAGDAAADSFGHLGLHDRIDRLSAALHDHGDNAAAAACQTGLHDTLEGRGVLPSVLAEIAAEADAYQPDRKRAPASTSTAKKTAAKKSTAKTKSATKKTATKRQPRAGGR
jgi:hypothetical protein